MNRSAARHCLLLMALSVSSAAAETEAAGVTGGLFCQKSEDLERIVKEGIRNFAKGPEKSSCSVLAPDTKFEIVKSEIVDSGRLELAVAFVELQSGVRTAGVILIPR